MVSFPDEYLSISIYISIYLSHRKAMRLRREKKKVAWILTALLRNILRYYFIQVGIVSNSMFIYRNLTRGVGRFRELLRAVETRTTQNLRMVSYIKPCSYCCIWISGGRESIKIVDELETNSQICSILIRTWYPTLYKVTFPGLSEWLK